MSDEISSPLLTLIRENGLIDDLQYEEVAAELKRSGANAIQVLQDFGIMKLDDILHVEATALGTEVISLKDREIPDEALKLIPAKVAQMYHCLPVSVSNGSLQVALAEPLDPNTASEVGFAAKRDVQILVADPTEILKAIERLYGQEESESFSELLKEIDATKNFAKVAAVAEDDTKAAEELANAAPVVKFVNMVLQQAVADRASDIHFEPFETDFRIRYRVDGALYEMSPPPKSLALPVTSRIKIMSNLNISERRMPQDGRISMTIWADRLTCACRVCPRPSVSRWCCAFWTGPPSTWNWMCLACPRTFMISYLR